MQFVFDLDGTICFRGKPISKNILDTLASLTRNGHEVIFASARPIRDMLPVINDKFHHYTMIGGNGSLISVQGEVVYAKAFSPKEITEIIGLIDVFEATYLIDGEWDYAYTGPHDHPILQNLDPAKLAQSVSLNALTTIVKVLIITSNDTEQLAERLSNIGVYVNKHRNEDVIDISPTGIHKWHALEKLGIKKGGYVAFGNDANDISMFENALHTVMIGNHEQLAQVADETIYDGEYLEQKIVAKLNELCDMYV